MSLVTYNQAKPVVTSSRADEQRARCGPARINLIILLMSYEHIASTLLARLQLPAAPLPSRNQLAGLRTLPDAKTRYGVF